MKIKSIKWLLMLMCLPLLTACGWEDLPAYEEAEISAVQFYYRWASSDKDPITGEPVVKERQLGCTFTINSEAGTVDAKITVPAVNDNIGFTEAVRSQVSLEKLWAQATISTAARLTPIDGSAPLGTPDNWTTPHSYKVMAANGDTKVWTIRIVEFKK